MLIVLSFFNRKMKAGFKESRKQVGELNSQIEDSLLGIRVVKSFANEELEQNKFNERNTKFLEIKSKVYHIMAGFQSSTRLFDGVMYIVVVVIGAIFMIKEHITAADYMAYLLFVSTLLTSIRRIVEFAEQFQRGMTGIERFVEIMDIEPEIQDEKDAGTLNHVKGKIEFKDVLRIGGVLCLICAAVALILSFVNMITVENPVEQKIFGARQMPVVNTTDEEQRDKKYVEALAAALRSDPDTLMVGEIRTLAAAQLTIRGALSGHNVWTTLHANSAMAALTRLLDLGIEPFKLKEETLMRGLVSMRLFKKVCPHCREPLMNHPERGAYRRVMDAYGELGLRQVYQRGAGCSHCKGSGHMGRIKAGEIIITSSEFLRLALSGNTDAAVRYWMEEMDGRRP